MELLFGTQKQHSLYYCELFFYNCVFVGNMRRFRRICEHTQSVVSVVRRPLPPNSPRAQRRVTSGPTVQPAAAASSSNNNTVDRMGMGAGGKATEISESSSNNSDISERLQGNKIAVVTASSQASATAAGVTPGATTAGSHSASAAAQAAVALRQVGLQYVSLVTA